MLPSAAVAATGRGGGGGGPSSSTAAAAKGSGSGSGNTLLLSLHAFEASAAGFSVEREGKVEDSVVASCGATLSQLSKVEEAKEKGSGGVGGAFSPLLFPTTRAAAAAALSAAAAPLNGNAPPRWGILSSKRPGRILPLKMAVDAEGEEDLNDEVCRVCWQGVRFIFLISFLNFLSTFFFPFLTQKKKQY